MQHMIAFTSHWQPSAAVDLSRLTKASCANSPKVTGAGFVEE